MKLSGRMPDITLAQLTAFFAWVVAQAVAFGWLDTQRSQVILSGGATVLAAVWKLADALIRSGRAKALAVNPSLGADTTPVAK